MTKKTMFGKKKPAHKWLADLVVISSTDGARASVKELSKRLKNFGHDRQVMVKRAVVLAFNRANASAKKHTLSKKEKKQMRTVAKIYKRFANEIKID